MSDSIGNVGNPTVGRGGTDRFGSPLGRPWRAYLNGAAIALEMSAPDTRAKCVFIDTAPRAAFLIRAPDGVTEYTVHYGRWIDAPTNHGAELGAWLETGSEVVTGVTAGALKEVVFETETDAVGCYVDTFLGAVAVDDSFSIWSRGLPRS